MCRKTSTSTSVLGSKSDRGLVNAQLAAVHVAGYAFGAAEECSIKPRCLLVSRPRASRRRRAVASDSAHSGQLRHLRAGLKRCCSDGNAEAAQKRCYLGGDAKDGAGEDADDGFEQAADDGNRNRHENTSLSGGAELKRAVCGTVHANLQ